MNSRIESAISNPEFLKKLSKKFRPSLLIDENGSIIADMGAVVLVNKTSVSKGKNDTFEITISPREHLSNEPVLEALDSDYTVKAVRGIGLDWVFHLNEIQRLAL